MSQYCKFNVFNIVALVALLVIGYFLYKKFNDKFKKGAIRFPTPIVPASVSSAAEAAPVIVETEKPKLEVIPEPGVKEE